MEIEVTIYIVIKTIPEVDSTEELSHWFNPCFVS